MRKGLAALAVAMVLAGMAVPAIAQTYVQLGVPFGMRLGGEVEIEGQGMIVRLTDLIEDSRCPIDAMCVWAGRVVVGLEVTVAAIVDGDPSFPVTIDTMDQTATVRGVVFSLLQAKPSLRSTETIAPEDMGFLIRADIISP
jgi:hypothetical protein